MTGPTHKSGLSLLFMITYKSPLTIRGDSLYCPLAFGLDSYWQCPYNCLYCFCRALNHTWGNEQRCADPAAVLEQLERGQANPTPRSPLAWAIHNKNTIRFGNKSDPFPPEEAELGVTRNILAGLQRLNWSIKLETKTIDFLKPDYLPLLDPDRVIITCTVTCGLNRDRKAFEPIDLPTPEARLRALADAQQLGFQVGVISEPFLPGWHTLEDWDQLLMALQDHQIKRVNVYHAHLNAFVLKRLNELPEIDIEKIYSLNQDVKWKPILHEIIKRTELAGITLGCPDWVNSGSFKHDCNTCCGVNVPVPTRFNFINWKEFGLVWGNIDWEMAQGFWDGVGNLVAGQHAFDGTSSEFYGFRDIGWSITERGWQPGMSEKKKHGFF